MLSLKWITSSSRLFVLENDAPQAFCNLAPSLPGGGEVSASLLGGKQSLQMKVVALETVGTNSNNRQRWPQKLPRIPKKNDYLHEDDASRERWDGGVYSDELEKIEKHWSKDKKKSSREEEKGYRNRDRDSSKRNSDEVLKEREKKSSEKDRTSSRERRKDERDEHGKDRSKDSKDRGKEKDRERDRGKDKTRDRDREKDRDKVKGREKEREKLKDREKVRRTEIERRKRREGKGEK
ncbi:RNA-binding protein 25-like [Hibiscus syriacus]|uniref:RNA-binding protein 25-like n=1 Tax=Hibiscus syriacus TaxID=106335 RepID=UPI001922C893|nr:RNA-binding protein 25-like [Hibiscus syriacus]